MDPKAFAYHIKVFNEGNKHMKDGETRRGKY